MIAQLGQYFSNGLFLCFVVGIPAYAAYKNVEVYDEFITGAKQGIRVILKILPHLIAMFVAIGMFRASGGFTLLGQWIGPLFELVGIPRDVMPLAMVRPFSGSASNALLLETIQTHGPDSLLSRISATIMGSTETTFYVLAIYFGSVGIKRSRYAVPTGLIADFAGVVAAVWVCYWLFT